MSGAANLPSLPTDLPPSPEEAQACARLGLTLVQLRAQRRLLERGGRGVFHDHVRTHAPHLAGVTEAEEQLRILAELRSRGWTVWRIGQRNARGTQDPGVPDVYALHERHGALWVECKRPCGGVQSPAQSAFQAHCEAAGVRYVCGALEAVRAALDEIEQRPDPAAPFPIPET